MDISQQVIPYFTTVILLALTPGPTVVGVISLAIQNNYSSSLLFIAGILIANGVFIVFSAVVKSIGFVIPPALASFMVMIGSLGLLYLGGKMLLSTFYSVTGKNNTSKHDISRSSNDYLLIGFVHHASNPKTVAFFVSMFLSIVPLDDQFIFNVTLLGIFTILIDAIILTTYSLFFSTASSIALNEKNLLHKLPVIASLIILYLAISNLLNSFEFVFGVFRQ